MMVCFWVTATMRNRGSDFGTHLSGEIGDENRRDQGADERDLFVGPVERIHWPTP